MTHCTFQGLVLKFLQDKSEVYAYDDFITKIKSPRLKRKIIKYNKIQSFNFDQIILSPGIDINNCKLSNFLKKNKHKIYTDLDVFFSLNHHHILIQFHNFQRFEKH